jgi:para-aminobenzoate synthetase component 1
MRASLNRLGREKTPFFFLISYDLTEHVIIPMDETGTDIRFEIDGFASFEKSAPQENQPILFEKNPAPFEAYRQKFDALQEEIARGNTYLANLTMQTPVTCSAPLEALYASVQARFKLFFKNRFVVFSPERFVRISGTVIETFPMKGTIDAAEPDAAERILSDPKELAEHTMVVDLLRNDLSIVAKKVTVERFRYTEAVRTADKTLIQVSSHISGQLEPEWNSRIGDILLALLPAGSITGTPKKKSVEILQRIEGYERGFFSGVFGYFDGSTLDSSVMIRYIEQTGSGLVFKSGGGITSDSDVRKEYDELVDKVYVPVY